MSMVQSFREATRVDWHARPPALLVVEDEALLRVALCDYLQDCGFKTYEAASAADAIEILQAGIGVDLMVSDVRLGGVMDGFGLAQWVRRVRPGLPVILTSGDPTKKAVARKLCVDEEFLSKPYSYDGIALQIRTMIEAG